MAPKKKQALKRKATIAKRKSTPRKQKQPKSAPAPVKKGYAPGLLGGIGNAVGGWFGGGAGASVGSSIGNWLGKITGMGSYKVKRNSFMGSGSQGPPVFNGGSGATIISHREFLNDVRGSIAFTNTQYAINPGLNTLFPWLARIAQEFEEYELLGMIVEFKSTSSVALNSINTALGTVIMATNYDISDTPFTSKQQMEAYEYATSCAPSVSMIHPIECDPKQNVLKQLYIRSDAVPSNTDQRFFDLGNFQFATVGMQSESVIGELWVSYHVKLTKPKLPTPLTSLGSGAHWSVTSASYLAPFGPAGMIKRSGSSNITATPVGTTVTGIPAGRWLAVYYSWHSSVSTSYTFSPISNINALNILNGNTVSTFITTIANAFTCVNALFDVVGGTTGSFSLTGGNANASANTDFFLISLPGDLGDQVKQTLEQKLALLEDKFQNIFLELAHSQEIHKEYPEALTPYQTVDRNYISSIGRGLVMPR